MARVEECTAGMYSCVSVIACSSNEEKDKDVILSTGTLCYITESTAFSQEIRYGNMIPGILSFGMRYSLLYIRRNLYCLMSWTDASEEEQEIPGFLSQIK